jgi:uncharacterized protein
MEHKTLFVNDAEWKFASDGAGEFEGMAAVYGNKDLVHDIIMPNAFASSVNKTDLLLYFQHDYFMPVGKILQMSESTRGLKMKGQLTPNHSMAQDVRAGMQHGTLTGLSVGFNIPKGGYEIDADGIRKIIKADLQEVSITNRPANPKARINLDSVKSLVEGIDRLSDLEEFLTDHCNLSRQLAKAVISKAKRAAEPIAHAPASADLSSIIKMIESQTRNIIGG